MILRIGFTDTFDGAADFFMDWMSDLPGIEIVRNDIDPQILFFGDENFGHQNRNFDPSKVIKIFYTGENRRFQNYECHYGITFDHMIEPNHFRLPLYVLNIHYLNKRFDLDLLHYQQCDRVFSQQVADREFCGFVQSNPHCSYRNEFYMKLSQYKKINSAGPLFNNTGYVIPRGERGVVSKMNFLGRHKFSFAFENGASPGYVTEKALEAYMAGTIPIYWGSVTVGLDFNTKALISRHNFQTDTDFVEYIKAVDSDDQMYKEKYEQVLVWTKEQSIVEPNIHLEKKRFHDWFMDRVVNGSGKFHDKRSF